MELDYAGLMNNRLVASGIYTWMMPPSYDADRNLHAYSFLLRYYLGYWRDQLCAQEVYVWKAEATYSNG